MNEQQILLTVQLHNVNEKTENRFDRAMEERGWNPLQNFTRTFVHTVSDEPEPGERTENEVRNAAKDAGVTDWDAIRIVSSGEPLIFRDPD